MGIAFIEYKSYASFSLEQKLSISFCITMKFQQQTRTPDDLCKYLKFKRNTN